MYFLERRLLIKLKQKNEKDMKIFDTFYVLCNETQTMAQIIEKLISSALSADYKFCVPHCAILH